MTSPSPDLASLPGFTDNLICVVGIGRSGTTVLKNALGAHPSYSQPDLKPRSNER